jgi:AraC-like DNA-binding protein
MLRYVEARPHPKLRPYLECVWEVTDPHSSQARGPERVVPDGCPELILHLGDLFARRVGGRWKVQPRAFLAGPLTRPWTLRAGRRVCTVGLRFRPGATTAPFPIDLHTTADREVPLAQLAGTEGARGLLEALGRAPTRTLRFQAAQEWLRPRIPSSAPRGGDAREAVQLVLRAGGRRRVDEIAAALGWSRRRLERVFARHVGLRPKLFARIVRINAVLAGLDAGERAAAVDIALGAGYFDQAHLLRDFRALVGRTPRARRESDGELARHFTHPGRLRALLAGDDASHSSKPRRPRPA